MSDCREGTGQNTEATLGGTRGLAWVWAPEATTQDSARAESSVTLRPPPGPTRARLPLLQSQRAREGAEGGHPLATALLRPCSASSRTHRVTLDHLAFGVLDHHHQLGLEGDD